MGRPGALVALDHDAVLDRIAGGEHAAHIAQELGVSKQALHYQLRDNPEYASARETAWQMRLDRLNAKIAALAIPQAPKRPKKPSESATAEIHAEYQLAYESYKTDLEDWKAEVARREFDLACAREDFKATSWRAEREFPSRWGQRTHVTVEQVGDLAEKLRRARERTIEGEATPVAELPAGINAGNTEDTEHHGP